MDPYLCDKLFGIMHHGDAVCPFLQEHCIDLYI